MAENKRGGRASFAPAAGDHGLGQCGREEGEPGASGPLL